MEPETPVPLLNRRGRPPSADSTGELRVCRRHGLVIFHLCSQGKREEAGGGCAVCGYDRCIVNLHFHHVDPATKSFTMSVASGKGLAKLRAEATKCVLVCANCHREIESGLIESPPAGTKGAQP